MTSLTGWHNYDPTTGAGDPSTPLTADRLNAWGAEAEQVRADAQEAAGVAQGAAASTDTVMAARIADPNSQTRPAVAGVVDTAIDDADVLKGDQHRAPKTGEPQEFRIRDVTGRVALAVDQDGATTVGTSKHVERFPGWRVTDQHGRIALEVDADGRTHIYDPGNATPVTTLHVFIAAGQSNMSGRGQPVEAPTSPRVMQYGANRRALETATVPLDMVDSPSGTSPATFFAHHYLATQPAYVGVLLVPAARGGTTFVGSPVSPAPSWTWTKGAAELPEHALYERSVQQALDAVAAARTAGYLVVLKGVLWHQGEGNSMPEQDYAAHLDALIGDYRADLGHATLPFVVGRMSPESIATYPVRQGTDAAHQDTPARVPYTGFGLSTPDGLNDPGSDITHFSTVGTAFLGDTLQAGYIQALGNVHPNH